MGQGAIAAGHKTTAAAGAEILAQGGNAFDAAIAAMLTACVSESVLTSIGGGGFLLAHTAAGENTLFDFFSQTPQAKTLSRAVDFYPIEANFGDVVQEFHIGLGAMAVPGTLAGVLRVHQRLGRLPLKEVAAPAIHHARVGVEVNPFFAYCYQLLKPILLANPETRAMYAPTGTLLKAGERLRLPQFADTLDALVQADGKRFYQGEIAARIAQDCAAGGGYLTPADFAQYRVIERQPLEVSYRGATLLTNPPPSSGGALIAFSLKLLEAMNLGELVPGSAAHLGRLAGAMRLTNQARRDGYDDQLQDPDVARQFLSQEHLAHYGAALGEVVNKWGSTTHISVIDAEGNAASVTSSNGEGSAYVIPGTQIMVNNMLGEEDLNPQGFHQWQPGQRISSMMAPTLILDDQQKPRLALGSGGSNRIRTAILQVISNVVDFQMSIEAAVAAPRIHWENGVFHLEPGLDAGDAAGTGDSLLADGILALGDRPVWWPQQNMFFGGVHAVSHTAQGITAAGDPRRQGAIATLP